MMILRRSARGGPATDGAPAVPDPSPDWREHESAIAGYEDALAVASGERVVRAILAHYAVPTFRAIWPDVDWDLYRRSYAEAPGAKPPLDRRQRDPGATGYQGPLRRTDDLG